MFAQPHPWTQDISALAPAASSDAIISALTAAGGWGIGTFRIDFSMPLLRADGGTPVRTISAPPGGYCFGGAPDCDPVPFQMPLPANGNVEGSGDYVCGGGDCHVLVLDTAGNRLYELYQANESGADFTAEGAFVWDLGKQYPVTLRGDQCVSADSSGLPIAPLLPTSDEVAAGEIAHAVRFALPNSRVKKDVFVRPAANAGLPTSLVADAPRVGVRFRLKASFDESSYTASQKVVLRALKTYGMILADAGSIPLTFADDRLSANKWAALGISSTTFQAITPGDFEIVDLGADIALTFNCVRNP